MRFYFDKVPNIPYMPTNDFNFSTLDFNFEIEVLSLSNCEVVYEE